jgi:hypothetical protein
VPPVADGAVGGGDGLAALPADAPLNAPRAPACASADLALLIAAASARKRRGRGGPNRGSERHCPQADTGVRVSENAGDEAEVSRDDPGQGGCPGPRGIDTNGLEPQ